jgi:hypothetical protein
MPMQTVILGEHTANLTVAGLIKQAAGGSIELRDADGNVVVYVLSPKDEQAWAYAEARVYFENHREAFREASARRSGVTTAELLAKAEALSNQD